MCRSVPGTQTLGAGVWRSPEEAGDRRFRSPSASAVRRVPERVLNPGSPEGSACPWGLRRAPAPQPLGGGRGYLPLRPAPSPPHLPTPHPALGDPLGYPGLVLSPERPVRGRWASARTDPPQAVARHSRPRPCPWAAPGADRGGGASCPSPSRARITHPPRLSASLLPKLTARNGSAGRVGRLDEQPPPPSQLTLQTCTECLLPAVRVPLRAARCFL